MVTVEIAMKTLLVTLLTISSFALACAAVPLKPIESDAESEIELAKVQGTWVRTIKTKDGTLKVVKVHKGNKTTLTYFDSKDNVLAAKSSEFRLENTGKVRIFTFVNNVVTAGPQKGQVDKGPHSYIYRITGDTFFEANGYLIGSGDEPVAFAWRRIKSL
jgi:hypothetical protein